MTHWWPSTSASRHSSQSTLESGAGPNKLFDGGSNCSTLSDIGGEKFWILRPAVETPTRTMCSRASLTHIDASMCAMAGKLYPFAQQLAVALLILAGRSRQRSGGGAACQRPQFGQVDTLTTGKVIPTGC